MELSVRVDSFVYYGCCLTRHMCCRERLPSPMASSPARLQGTHPHYKLGDLGLIPRPALHIPSSLDKMKDYPPASGLGGLRKILTKSVGTQTLSSQKVSLFDARTCSHCSSFCLYCDMPCQCANYGRVSCIRRTFSAQKRGIVLRLCFWFQFQEPSVVVCFNACFVHGTVQLTSVLSLRISFGHHCLALAFQTMFFADQLLSRMPNTSQVLHDLNVTERDATIVPLSSVKKVPASRVY